jgi:hypothetical protein
VFHLPSLQYVFRLAWGRVQDLDEAVLRRFSKRIFCGLPDTAAREEILNVPLPLPQSHYPRHARTQAHNFPNILTIPTSVMVLPEGPALGCKMEALLIVVDSPAS